MIRTLKNIILLLTLFGLIACSGSKKILSTTDQTALFLPPKIEAGVDMFVDEIDGRKVKFQLSDSAMVDAGSHEVLVRLEYEPAVGSSIIVGGLGNLLLRSATNKTFKTKMDIKVEQNNTYQFVVTAAGESFDIAVLNTGSKVEIVKHSFQLKDGHFEKLF